MHLTKRLAALAGVVGALAIAAPIAEASTAPTLGAYPGFSYPGFSLPDFASWPVSAWVPTFVEPPVGAALYSRGPTVINDIFNGATVVQVANGPTYSAVVASP
jgi:hypothetical protein